MDLISVTGPIATGATTLASNLAKENHWTAFLEPNVESANPYFQLYHNNPTHYAFHNQIQFLITSSKIHFNILHKVQPGEICVQDYTPFEHMGVYAWVQYQFGLLSKEEYNTLIELSQLLESKFILPRVLVYRPLTQELLVKRIQERGRPSEQNLKFEFLDAVRQRFEDWTKAWDKTPVVRVDEKLDILEDQYAINNLSKLIKENIKF